MEKIPKAVFRAVVRNESKEEAAKMVGRLDYQYQNCNAGNPSLSPHQVTGLKEQTL